MNRLEKSDVQPHPFPSDRAHRDRPLHLHKLRIPKHPINTLMDHYIALSTTKTNSSSGFDCCLRLKKNRTFSLQSNKSDIAGVDHHIVLTAGFDMLHFGNSDINVTRHNQETSTGHPP